MNKVVGCLFVSLALAVILVVDVVSTAPPWTVYAEWAGLVLSIIAAILYFMQARKDGKSQKAARKKAGKKITDEPTGENLVKT
ncbi:MAG: hypothetical protein HOG95_03645 [Rhodospirillaceae bacterium]|jgi:protein-S-isoprenylcysteine O-methyltransferase Ste14|nr:hypothetical protein [Rhodospirillaceae bacterium]MBT5938997.1 hypothetical protein [Rhodospirillaceae bacterium]MBT7266716.1 hypothetical protein [Rhodospirillaceae bacterium]